MASIFAALLPKKKPKAGRSFLPSFLVRTAKGATVSDSRTNRTNEDLTQLRYGASTAENVRNYIKNSPDVSHAAECTMRFLVTDAFTVVAKDLENDTINPEATKAVQAFAARINKLPTTYDGFSRQSSINSVAESLVIQMLGNGDCCSELVLDKQLIPALIQPISTNNLKWQSAGDRVFPYIDDQGITTELDSPAIYVASLSQDPETPYAESWYKAAIQSIISSTEFTDDLRRSFRKASLPRVKATIDTEKFLASLSPDVKFDQEKVTEEMNKTLTSIEDKLNGLNPEDAVINFDIVAVDHLTAGNISSHDSVSTHAGIVNGQMSTGLHVLPSILGRGESQTTASTETVLFLKLVESLQDRLNEVFSYMFTLSARLQGHDVTVDFKFKKPSLRPEVEEEGFQAMKQSRILEQLSLGLISDEEASIALTGDLPSGNFTPLSGTGFHNKKAESPDNPYSNTSVSGDQLNNTKDQKDRTGSDKQPKSNKTSGK